MPPGGLTTRVAEADNPTTARTALTSTTTSRATLMTLTLTFSPRAAPMTLSLISAPHAAPTTPPVASLVALDSPPATQPVPHVLQASAVTVSPMVHLHSMQTRGAVSFRQPKLYIAATLSLSLPEICSCHPHQSTLVGGYGERVRHPHVQRHLGLGSASP
jgi:hypothetical protein